MKDVAERAGVSIATVSFVVNRTKRVSPGTRERIERAMAELGFRQNLVARALASRRTRIIALVFPVEHSMGGSASDFVSSAAQAAADADYHLMIWPDRKDGSQLSGLIGNGLVEGVLLMEVEMADARVDILRELDFPFAMIGRTEDTAGLHCVDIDFGASLGIALDYLQGLGHRRIVLVSGSKGEGSAEGYGPHARTVRAYREVATERGIEPVVMGTRHTVTSGRLLAQQLATVTPRPTAVVVRDSEAVAGLVAGLQGRGVRVPADISVLSLLSPREMALGCHPSLTVVSSPGSELGRLGVEALLRRLDGGPATEPTLRAGSLVLGESTGPVASAGDGGRAPAAAG